MTPVDAALVVIDVQNDFCPGGHWRCRTETQWYR